MTGSTFASSTGGATAQAISRRALTLSVLAMALAPGPRGAPLAAAQPIGAGREQRPSGAESYNPALLLKQLPQARPPQAAGFGLRLLGAFLQENLGQAFGVLLGVGAGNWALELLGSWPGGVLFLVDPYIHLRRGYQREANLEDDDHQRQYEHLRNVLHDKAEVQGRYSFVREFSFAVPKLWLEKQWGPRPKFVYQDANPSYGAVRTDLRSWWPLLDVNGIMAGSNYTTLGDGTVIGVRRAVDEFAQERGLQVFLTSDAEPTWILLKEVESQ